MNTLPDSLNNATLSVAALVEIGRRATDALLEESHWAETEEYGVLVELDTTGSLLVELDLLRLAAKATDQDDLFEDRFGEVEPVLDGTIFSHGR